MIDVFCYANYTVMNGLSNDRDVSNTASAKVRCTMSHNGPPQFTKLTAENDTCTLIHKKSQLARYNTHRALRSIQKMKVSNINGSSAVQSQF